MKILKADVEHKLKKHTFLGNSFSIQKVLFLFTKYINVCCCRTYISARIIIYIFEGPLKLFNQLDFVVFM